MSDSDPMFRDVIIAVRRLVNFTILSSIISILLWTLVLTLKLNIDFGDLPIWWRSGWKSPSNSHLAQVLFFGCWLIGLLSAGIFYLVMWARWLKRGNINSYQRGAQISQRRI